MSNAADPTRRGTSVDESGTARSGGGHRALALALAVIVAAALAYGLVQTAIRASALFTG